MSDVNDLWLKYNDFANKLAESLGRTRNIVGEYAEYLAHQYYGGRLLEISEPSADIEAVDGTRYQIKARKIKDSMSTQLSVIRSWQFDYLVIILFNSDGGINKAVQIPVDVAKTLGKKSNHQNGRIITTSKKVLEDPSAIDITVGLSALNQ